MNARTVRKINRDLKRHLFSRVTKNVKLICVPFANETEKTADQKVVMGKKPHTEIKADVGALKAATKAPESHKKTAPKTQGTPKEKQKSKEEKPVQHKHGGEKKHEDAHKGGKKVKPPLKVKIGSVVEDRVASKDLKVIEVDIKNVPLMNLSDEVFSKMGDTMGDTLDFKHEKVFTGKEGAKKLKDFQNETKT